MIRRRSVRGTSLVEVLVVLLLLLWILQQGWAFLARYKATGIASANRAEELEAIRTIAWILPEEVSLGHAGVDWIGPPGDSLLLRAFRGLGMVDSTSWGGTTLTVCYRGLRAPAPEKDSVLVLEKSGIWRAHDLVARTPLASSCLEEEGNLEIWNLLPTPSPGLLARVFERGSYHFATRALRYRRGKGGRQPLTPERLESGRFMGPGEGGVSFAWEVTLGRSHSRSPLEQVRLWRGGSW